jgi:ribosomal protein L37E
VSKLLEAVEAIERTVMPMDDSQLNRLRADAIRQHLAVIRAEAEREQEKYEIMAAAWRQASGRAKVSATNEVVHLRCNRCGGPSLADRYPDTNLCASCHTMHLR